MSKPSKSGKIPCPRCGTKASMEGNPDRPFCSPKCRLIDLGRWAGEDYRIPGEKIDPPVEGQVVPFSREKS